MKLHKLKLDPGTLLKNSAASYQAYQVGRALGVLDPGGWNLYGVSLGGLLLGSIVNFTIAIAAGRLPTVAKARKPYALAGFILLMLLSPALVMVSLQYTFIHEVDQTLRWALAFCYSIAPDLAIGVGGFVAGKSFVSLGDVQQGASGDQATAKSRSTKASERKAKLKAAQAVACKYSGAGCNRSGTQNAMNAHARNCPYKPTVIDVSVQSKANKES